MSWRVLDSVIHDEIDCWTQRCSCGVYFDQSAEFLDLVRMVCMNYVQIMFVIGRWYKILTNLCSMNEPTLARKRDIPEIMNHIMRQWMMFLSYKPAVKEQWSRKMVYKFNALMKDRNPCSIHDTEKLHCDIMCTIFGFRQCVSACYVCALTRLFGVHGNPATMLTR